jgi:hypothetical protein
MQPKWGALVSGLALMTFVCGGSGCAGGTPIVYPPTAEHAGVLRVVEVFEIERGQEFPESNPYFELSIESGITPAQFRAGQFARGRAYCCGGSTERRNTILFFVPLGVDAKLGDVIELRMGRAPSKDGARGFINTATRVRDRATDGRVPTWGDDGDWTGRSCRWVPESDALWGRLLYCDWMPEEGWVEYDGFWGAWIKRVE